MSVTLTLTLDDATARYLERIAADQARTPAEVAAWIVTEDLRRELAIDAELVARLDAQMTGQGGGPADQPIASDDPPTDEATPRERASA